SNASPSYLLQQWISVPFPGSNFRADTIARNGLMARHARKLEPPDPTANFPKVNRVPDPPTKYI
ncbi:hypothetical protein GWI33_010223, partial [Rhynchophorus ferrugineus]